MIHQELAALRRSQFAQELEAVLPEERSVVLMDIPRFANVGDNAILLGELATLRALGRRPVHLATPGPRYDPVRLRRRIQDRPILLHGGGNLGDLWPAHQQLREQLLADFRDRAVVQLPQSLAFRDEASVERARRAFTHHPRFTLLVRDEPSRVYAQAHLGTTARLVPDAAFGLGPLRRRGQPTRDLLVLARTDHEARGTRTLPPGIRTEDWVVPRLGGNGRRVHALAEALDRRPGQTPIGSEALARVSMLAWARVAAEHVRHGLDLLCSARVVVTDRLHAHVLSLLLGIPHVVTDNVSGKIRGLYEAWTCESDLVTWADSLREGVEKGAALLPAG